MNKTLRKAVIAGNWKMNKNRAETAALIEEIKPLVAGAGCDVVVCTPFTNLDVAVSAASGSNVKVGAQNVHFEANGAFTGEIPASALTELAVSHVIIGHSERRQYFAETNETVNLRTKAALAAGLVPIVCVGETLEEREAEITFETIALQLKAALSGISVDDFKKIIIAYEPVWAIGTGKTATADQAEEVCAYIRGKLAAMYCEECANAVTIQYGGSMNAANAAELLSKENIDGGLIGGASLKAADFTAIIDAAK
jgi:triosephosphate isomerase